MESLRHYHIPRWSALDVLAVGLFLVAVFVWAVALCEYGMYHFITTTGMTALWYTVFALALGSLLYASYCRLMRSPMQGEEGQKIAVYDTRHYDPYLQFFGAYFIFSLTSLMLNLLFHNRFNEYTYLVNEIGTQGMTLATLSAQQVLMYSVYNDSLSTFRNVGFPVLFILIISLLSRSNAPLLSVEFREKLALKGHHQTGGKTSSSQSDFDDMDTAGNHSSFALYQSGRHPDQL